MNEETKLRYPAHDDEPLRPKVYIILHLHSVWKKTFFSSKEQAFNVIKMFHKHEEFYKEGNSLVGKKTHNRFTVYEVYKYTKMDDIKYAHEQP